MEPFIKVLTEYGFSEAQIEKIISDGRTGTTSGAVLARNATDIFELFESYRCPKKKIIAATTHYSDVFTSTILALKNKIKFLNGLGFSDEKIKSIICNSLDVLLVGEEKIKKRILDLKSLGFSKKQLDKMYNNYPSIFSRTILIADANYDEGDVPIERRLYDLMHLNEGENAPNFTKNELLRKVPSDPILISYSIDTLKSRYKALQNLGFDPEYTDEEALKIVYSYPIVLSKSTKIVNKHISELVQLGFSKDEIRRMIKYYPAVLTKVVLIDSIGEDKNNDLDEDIEEEDKESAANKTIEARINGLISLGYTREVAMGMCVAATSILNFPTETLASNISIIMQIGYSYEQVLNMGSRYPNLLVLDTTKNVIPTFKGVCDLNFSKEEAMELCFCAPEILGGSIENLSPKIEFYRSVGLDRAFFKNPKILRQGIKKSYARYHYLTHDRGKKITSDHCWALFLSEKEFKKKFGVSTNSLMETYNYDRDVENGQEKRKKRVLENE